MEPDQLDILLEELETFASREAIKARLEAFEQRPPLGEDVALHIFAKRAAIPFMAGKRDRGMEAAFEGQFVRFKSLWESLP
jgi:hypothetical protein